MAKKRRSFLDSFEKGFDLAGEVGSAWDISRLENDPSLEVDSGDLNDKGESIRVKRGLTPDEQYKRGMDTAGIYRKWGMNDKAQKAELTAKQTRAADQQYETAGLQKKAMERTERYADNEEKFLAFQRANAHLDDGEYFKAAAKFASQVIPDGKSFGIDFDENAGYRAVMVNDGNVTSRPIGSRREIETMLSSYVSPQALKNAQQLEREDKRLGIAQQQADTAAKHRDDQYQLGVRRNEIAADTAAATKAHYERSDQRLAGLSQMGRMGNSTLAYDKDGNGVLITPQMGRDGTITFTQSKLPEGLTFAGKGKGPASDWAERVKQKIIDSIPQVGFDEAMKALRRFEADQVVSGGSGKPDEGPPPKPPGMRVPARGAGFVPAEQTDPMPGGINETTPLGRAQAEDRDFTLGLRSMLRGTVFDRSVSDGRRPNAIGLTDEEMRRMRGG